MIIGSASSSSENIYDHLEKFFATHDLDKLAIEATSGETSASTNAEPPAALQLPTPVNERAWIRVKDRTSSADLTSAYADNMRRKRSTKL